MARRILFAVSDPTMPAQLVKTYDVEYSGSLVSYDDVLLYMQRQAPEILIIADNLVPHQQTFMETLRSVHQIHPNCRVVAILSPLSEAYKPEITAMARILDTTRAGIDEIAKTLDLLYKPSGQQLIYTCWALKGGVGKTSMNIALTQMIKRVRPSSRALVWDLDLADGDVALGMNLIRDDRRIRTLNDVIQAPRITPRIVEECILHHPPSDVDVLAAPYLPQEKPDLTTEAFHQILDSLLALRYDIIDFDMGTEISVSPVIAHALTRCQAIYLIITPDKFALKAIQRVIDVLKILDIFDRCVIIINKNRQHHQVFTQDEIFNAFQIPILGGVAPDPCIDESQQEGRPIWEYSNAKSVTDIEIIARQILTRAFGDQADLLPSESGNARKGPLSLLWRKERAK